MQLSFNSLIRLMHGGYRYEKMPGGYAVGRHYTPEQLDYLKFSDFFHVRGMFSSSNTLEFVTDATEFSFDYLFAYYGSKDTVDMFVNGVPVRSDKVENLAKRGTLTYSLNPGKKTVVVYLPLDSEMWIKRLRINGKWRSVKKKTKVLWAGDSITQGYGTFVTSQTYVNVCARKLGLEVVNQGIGGYYYDEKVLSPLPGFEPDFIVLAHGTNQHKSADKRERVEKYFAKLVSLYPSTPILAITPLWRNNESTKIDQLTELAGIIKEQAAKYPNVSVVDGFGMVPNVPYYFFDGLHPNALGGEVYGENVAQTLVDLELV